MKPQIATAPARHAWLRPASSVPRLHQSREQAQPNEMRWPSLVVLQRDSGRKIKRALAEDDPVGFPVRSSAPSRENLRVLKSSKLLKFLCTLGPKVNGGGLFLNIFPSDASLLAPKLRWDRPNRARNQKRSIALPQVDKLLQQYSKTLSKKLDSCSDTHHTGCKNCPGGCDEPEPLPPFKRAALRGRFRPRDRDTSPDRIANHSQRACFCLSH